MTTRPKQTTRGDLDPVTLKKLDDVVGLLYQMPGGGTCSFVALGSLERRPECPIENVLLVLEHNLNKFLPFIEREFDESERNAKELRQRDADDEGAARVFARLHRAMERVSTRLKDKAAAETASIRRSMDGEPAAQAGGVP